MKTDNLKVGDLVMLKNTYAHDARDTGKIISMCESGSVRVWWKLRDDVETVGGVLIQSERAENLMIFEEKN